MIELYFLLYRIPKMMSRLARERNRSPLAWSLMAIAAYVGAEFVVMLGLGVIYGVGIVLWAWPNKEPAPLILFSYIAAIGAAIGSVALVRRKLSSISDAKEFPLPPPPPRFD